MSFAGVSLIRDGRLCPSAPAISDAGAAGGYHLLVVEGYSRTKAEVPHGHHIESGPFRVGGYLWFLKYYPNGSTSARPGSASASTILAQDVAKPVKAQFVMSFIGQSDKQESTYISSTEVCEFPCRSAGMSYLNFVSRDEFEYSQHLKDNSFTLRCDVLVLNALVDAKGAGAASPFVTVPLPDMQRHFTDLLKDKEGADVTFEVGGETIAAHRCVLAARSRVFRAELFGPMKESTAAGYTIHVEDMEPQVFKAMLEFIYNDAEPEIEKDDDEDAMWQWQHLLAAADRYDMQRLKLICEDKLCGFVELNSTAAILSLAEQHCCDGLKKACYVFLGVLGNLRAVAATDGFDDLIRSYPSVMKELITMLAPF